jgi:uncharacterized protein (DUF1330 family)
MAVYVISEVDVVDEQLANEYRELAAPSIAKYGGKYLARGADPLTMEGVSSLSKWIIVVFESMGQAKRWYASDEYAKALKVRRKALKRRLIFVDGISS